MTDYLYLPSDIASRLPDGFRIRISSSGRVSVEKATPAHKLLVEADRGTLVVESWLGEMYDLERFLKAVDDLAYLHVQGIHDVASWVDTVDNMADAVYSDEYDPEHLETDRSYTGFRFRYWLGKK